jgi:hypothetical protein
MGAQHRPCWCPLNMESFSVKPTRIFVPGQHCWTRGQAPLSCSVIANERCLIQGGIPDIYGNNWVKWLVYQGNKTLDSGNIQTIRGPGVYAAHAALAAPVHTLMVLTKRSAS